MASLRPVSAIKPLHHVDELEMGNRLDVSVHDPFSLRPALVDERKEKKPAVKNFYVKQNEQIKNMLQSVEGHRQSAKEAASSSDVRAQIAVYGSLALNLILAGAQLYAAVSSKSMSLFATMVDSIFDPVSNLIMLYCHRAASKADESKWPSGKTRLTTVGNICFCFVMACASAILMVESIRTVAERVGEPGPSKEPLHLISLLVVGGALVTKICMFLYCWPLKSQYPQVRILWEDHRNDLCINTVGIITSVMGAKVVWWIDPAGAMLLAIVIVTTWGRTALHEFSLLVGVSATPEFLQLVTYTCVLHHNRVLQLDTCRAYHAGEGIIIEVDVVMDKDLTLHETHDVAEDLQNKLEQLPGVERCFVHVDYETSHAPEHRKTM